MTIKDTMSKLGHKSVDVMVLDCAGCEWVLSYENIGQLLVTINDVRTDIDWFDQRTKENFVLFHREPIRSRDGIDGKAQALSLLRVRKSFFPAAMKLFIGDS